MHVIAGKAVAFKVAGEQEFAERQRRTLEGAGILGSLSQQDVADVGISVLTGGTDVHLVLVDLRNSELDGKQGEDLLRSRNHRQPQRRAVGSTTTDDYLRLTHRHPRINDSWIRDRSLRRSRRHHCQDPDCWRNR